MKRILDKIHKILKEKRSVGYIELYYNNEKIGSYATKRCLEEEGIETAQGMVFFEKNYIKAIKEILEKIEKAKKITINGDYYGDGFSGWLLEEIRFYEE